MLTEGDKRHSYTVVLQKAPTADVTVNITSDNEDVTCDVRHQFGWTDRLAAIG